MTPDQIIDVVNLFDVFIILIAFYFAEHLYWLFYPTSIIASDYPLVAAMASLIWFILSKFEKSGSKTLKTLTITNILNRLLAAFGLIIVMGYALKQSQAYSRLWFGIAFACAIVLLVAKSRIVAWMMRRDLLKSQLAENVALFGDPALIKSLIEGHDHVGSSCNYIPYESGGVDPAESGELNRLVADGLANRWSKLILCLPSVGPDSLEAHVKALSFLPVQLQACIVRPEIVAQLKSRLWVDPSQLFVNLDDQPQTGWSCTIKRMMDLLLATLLLVLVAPLMVIVACAIKMDSTGPVFFRQRRHGLNHLVISVLKFRTMTVLEDGDQVVQAVAGDRRVTRIGRFLRRTSLDELPQLVNVLKGEMSLVGPRPHALAHNMYYGDLIAAYADRHKVKPGITGWAQMRGLRGNCEDITQMATRAEADIWYIRNWSPWLDLKIIIQTPFALLFHKAAL